MEEWRTIKDFPNYMVSDLGRVKSLHRTINCGKGDKPHEYPETFLRPTVAGGGYERVTLCAEGKKYSRIVHILVARAFVPNPKGKPCVDHINTDKRDNRACNLRWVTYLENQHNPETLKHLRKSIKEFSKKESFRENLKKGLRKYYSKPETREKLKVQRNRIDYVENMRRNNGRTKPVVHYSVNGELLGEYYSASEAARNIGVTTTSMTAYCRGEIKPKDKTIWRYKYEVDSSK